MRNLQISLPKVGTFSSRLLRQHRSQFASEYLISQPSNHPTTPPAPCVDRLSTTPRCESTKFATWVCPRKSQHLSRGTKYLKVHHVDPSSISTKFNPYFPSLISKWMWPLDMGIFPTCISELNQRKKSTQLRRIRRQTSLPWGLVLHAVQQKGLLFGLDCSWFQAPWGRQAKMMAVQKHHHPNRKIKTFICWNQYDTKPTCCFSFNSPCCVPQLAYILEQTNSPSASIHSFVPLTLPVFTSHTFTRKNLILSWKSLKISNLKSV